MGWGLSVWRGGFAADFPILGRRFSSCWRGGRPREIVPESHSGLMDALLPLEDVKADDVTASAAASSGSTTSEADLERYDKLRPRAATSFFCVSGRFRMLGLTIAFSLLTPSHLTSSCTHWQVTNSVCGDRASVSLGGGAVVLSAMDQRPATVVHRFWLYFQRGPKADRHQCTLRCVRTDHPSPQRR